MQGSIAYRFATPADPKAQTLYVNVIPRYECSNRCTFCSREDAIKGLPNIYEKKAGTSLYLPEAPTISEVVSSVVKAGGATREIAFVGLGEPLLQFELVRDSISAIRKLGYKGKIRIDTNGYVQSKTNISFKEPEYVNLNLNPARELKRAGLNAVWISLNATNYKQYDQRCRPTNEGGWFYVRDFIKDCKRERLKVKLSFVIGGDYSPTPEECIKYAKSHGIKKKNVILRQYVPPLT